MPRGKSLEQEIDDLVEGFKKQIVELGKLGVQIRDAIEFADENILTLNRMAQVMEQRAAYKRKKATA